MCGGNRVSFGMADAAPDPDAGLGTDPVADLLGRAAAGDKDAVNQLFPLIYDELRRLAESMLRKESPGHTLNATAVAHEGFLRLVKSPGIAAETMTHFFAIAAQVLRRVLIDHARGRDRIKRGGDAQRVSLDTSMLLPNEPGQDITDLEEALQKLESLHQRQAKVVELKFFGGLTSEQIATVLGVSVRTVEADWSMARTWLRKVIIPR